MLTHLSIRDIVLIERLDLAFAHGLCVLTGETGAGKSILLDSLSLALGARGDGSLVRHGAERGQVTAVFDLDGDHPVRQLLRDNGFEDDGDLILRRMQNTDGRTKVFVNDQPASVALMQQLGKLLVEIHGQHDDRALVQPDAHRRLLDAFGGLQSRSRQVADLHQSWRAADKAAAEQRARVEEAAREADYLRASVEELEQLAPVDGEEEELAERRARMMKAERIAADINETNDVLSGHASPVPVLGSVLRRLERKAAEVPGLLDDIIAALDAAMNQLSEAQMATEAALAEAEFDPRELEACEERLFALRAASRKYSVPVSELPAHAERMVAMLTELDAGEERLAHLHAKVVECEKNYLSAAQLLSQQRHDTAGMLEAAVMAELPALKLDRAEFIVEIKSDADEGGPHGFDHVAFHVRTNPGARPGPILKVASGGELSRFLLALKVALADKGSAPTLVFDEIDSGAGGAVADAIGQRLKRLADNVQVLSVTHAPQVAARASTHMLIAKGPSGDETVTTRVSMMDSKSRREEIARMLAGASVTDEARAAAGRLLSENP
ncbi:MAG: DNA repair protein RecN [Pseudomonadota bacterium]